MDVWKAGDEVYKTMETLIANKPVLTPLALVDDQILIVFKEKASKNGGHAVLGKTAKANALLGVVSEIAYKFVITIAGDEWSSLRDLQREALLFHLLCACGVEENPESGVLKCFVRQPEVNFFREEVEEYGYWRTSGATPDTDLIDELFGPKPDSSPAPSTTAALAHP